MGSGTGFLFEEPYGQMGDPGERASIVKARVYVLSDVKKAYTHTQHRPLSNAQMLNTSLNRLTFSLSYKPGFGGLTSAPAR